MCIEYKRFTYNWKEIELPIFPISKKEEAMCKIIKENSFKLIRFTDEPPESLSAWYLELYIEARKTDIQNLKACIKECKKRIKRENSIFKRIKDFFYNKS